MVSPPPRARSHDQKSWSAWTMLNAIMLAAALPLLAAGMAAAAVVESTTTARIQGKLVYRTAHTQDIWKLVIPGGYPSYKLPAQPLDVIGEPIPVGSTIALDCKSKADGDGSCVKVSNAEVTRAAAPVRSTDVTLRLLVMVVSLKGGCVRAGAQVEQVRAAYLAEGGYADFLKSCSYGKVAFAPGDEGVTVMAVTVPCSPAILMCEEDAVAYFAKDAVKSQTNATFLASFNRFTYVMPYGMTSCAWVGLADLPGATTWYTPYMEGVFSKGTVLQETLHNFGIYHGWKDGYEYADYSTSMGSGNSCPSAPELWRLGWSTPLDLLDGSSLPSGAVKRYMLPATSLEGARNMLKIRPDWLGTSYTRNVYFALRLKTAGDKSLDEIFSRKISVHHLNKVIDNIFGASGDPRVTLLRTVDQQSTADLTDYKLIVRTGAVIQGGTKMALLICRYTTSADECQGNWQAAGDPYDTMTTDGDYTDVSPSPPRLPPPLVPLPSPRPPRPSPPPPSSPRPPLPLRLPSPRPPKLSPPRTPPPGPPPPEPPPPGPPPSQPPLLLPGSRRPKVPAHFKPPVKSKPGVQRSPNLASPQAPSPPLPLPPPAPRRPKAAG